MPGRSGAAVWASSALLATLSALPFTGCGSDGSGGTAPGDGGVEAPGEECLVDAQCDDGDVCTLDSCSEEGFCATEAAPDGDAQEQTEGDCSRTVCKDGVAEEVPDSGDVLDDEEQCTLDTCEGGAPAHVAVLDGTPCEIGAGNGECIDGQCLVLCTPGNALVQCNDLNPCTEDACLPCDLAACEEDEGICDHHGLSGMPTPNAPQTTGDCHERRCVEGKDEDVVDNFDVLDDGNECTDDFCEEGIALNEPLTAGTACGSSDYVCDGEGACVECLTAADCENQSGECHAAACESGYCTTEYAPAGTVLPDSSQTPGDCTRLVCDGSGSHDHEPDDTDVSDDQNPCTTDGCASGSPQHDPVAPGTSCGPGGKICTDSGYCCTPTSCAAQGLSCGTLNDGCGNTLSCGICDPGDNCSGGMCGCKNGYESGSETDVDCGGPFCPACAQGKSCSAGSDCAGGYCADGVCCDSACTGACRACVSNKTGLTTGTCGNVTDGTDPDSECATTSPSSCGTTGSCKAGACEMHAAGTVCSAGSCSAGVLTNPDTCNGAGVCVDGGSSACGAGYGCLNSTQCQSCSDGVLNGTEKDVDCGGGGGCAACANGKLCSSGADCSSGYCVDGRCCDGPCNGLCEACNLSSGYGTCNPIPNGQDPGNECNAPPTNTCNGARACN